jgi:hypothetical protein
MAKALINVIYGSVETMPVSEVKYIKLLNQYFDLKEKLTVYKDCSKKQASGQISEKNFSTSAGLIARFRKR